MGGGYAHRAGSLRGSFPFIQAVVGPIWWGNHAGSEPLGDGPLSEGSVQWQGSQDGSGTEVLLGTCLTPTLSSPPTATTVSFCPGMVGGHHRSPAGPLAGGTELWPMAVNFAHAVCPLTSCREVGGLGQSLRSQPSRTST